MYIGEPGYLAVMQHIMDSGSDRADRTGVGTRAILGAQIRFDLANGFPLLTTKHVWFAGVVHELLWMLSGSTNVNDLHPSVQKWWTPWANPDGSLGPTYGKQYRDAHGVDQLSDVVESIRTNPTSRRHIISLWDAADSKDCRLPPCHGSIIQFFVANGLLSCQTYCRSQDWFIGTPVNIAAYALLTHMIARLTGLSVGEYIHVSGDSHIYSNHHQQVAVQLSRTPMTPPLLQIRGSQSTISDFKFEDFVLSGYVNAGKLPAPVAV